MSAVATAQGAERAVERLSEMSLDLRACAILDADGGLLAESASADWAARSAELWASADVRGRPRPTQFHVAAEGGEVFAVRSPEATAIAVCERFTLASLMFCDLRAVIRDMGVPDRQPGGGG